MTMSTIGRTVSIKGEVRASEDVTIEGRVEGPIVCDDGSVVLAATAHVTGDVAAREITIFGRSDGQLLATDVVDIRAGATVTSQVVSKRFILGDGARFDGRVEPQHLEAALRVAKFQQKKRTSEIVSPTSGHSND
jgi:cytoskeletal protein CcmA (bactofilin family)